MLELFDYPITITKEDINNNLGINLDAETTNSNVFIRQVHTLIFDNVIYKTGSKSIKNRIIENYKQELEKDIKKALIQQADYMLANGMDIGKWNGLVKDLGGVDLKSKQDMTDRIICQEALNTLLSTEPNILYAGEYNV